MTVSRESGDRIGGSVVYKLSANFTLHVAHCGPFMQQGAAHSGEPLRWFGLLGVQLV